MLSVVDSLFVNGAYILGAHKSIHSLKDEIPDVYNKYEKEFDNLIGAFDRAVDDVYYPLEGRENMDDSVKRHAEFIDACNGAGEAIKEMPSVEGAFLCALLEEVGKRYERWRMSAGKLLVNLKG